MVLSQAGLDLTISLGDILAAGAFLATAIGGVYTIRGKVDTLAQTVDLKVSLLDVAIKTSDDANERRFAEMDNQMRDFRAEMKKLSDILIELTRQEGRMNTADERLLAQGKRVDSVAESLREVFKMISQIQRERAA